MNFQKGHILFWKGKRKQCSNAKDPVIERKVDVRVAHWKFTCNSQSPQSGHQGPPFWLAGKLESSDILRWIEWRQRDCEETERILSDLEKSQRTRFNESYSTLGRENQTKEPASSRRRCGLGLRTATPNAEKKPIDLRISAIV